MSSNEIGQKMMARRKALKLTLEDVGKAVGVGKSTVRKWENGMIKNMGSDKIAAVAAVLKMDPVEFVPGPTPQKKPFITYTAKKLIKSVGEDQVVLKTFTNRSIRSPLLEEGTRVVKVVEDPQLRSMMKLWKVSSSETKDAVIKVMEVMNKTEGKK